MTFSTPVHSAYSNVMQFVYLIFYFPCIVSDNECIFLFLRFLIKLVIAMNTVELLQKCFICGSREAVENKMLT